MSPELFRAAMDVANTSVVLQVPPGTRHEPRGDRTIRQRDPIHRSARAQQRMAETDWIGAINRQAQENVERRWRRSERPAFAVPEWLRILGIYSAGVVSGAMTVLLVAGWL